MPCELEYGLLPGRGVPGRGPGVGASPDGLAAGCSGAGFSAAGAGVAAGCSGSGALTSGAAGAGFGPGFGAGLAALGDVIGQP